MTKNHKNKNRKTDHIFSPFPLLNSLTKGLQLETMYLSQNPENTEAIEILLESFLRYFQDLFADVRRIPTSLAFSLLLFVRCLAINAD